MNLAFCLVSKHKGKRTLVRSRHSGGCNIAVGIKDTVCEEVDWMHLSQGGLQWWVLFTTVINPLFL
jgi:hypothetical protein